MKFEEIQNKAERLNVKSILHANELEVLLDKARPQCNDDVMKNLWVYHQYMRLVVYYKSSPANKLQSKTVFFSNKFLSKAEELNKLAKEHYQIAVSQPNSEQLLIDFEDEPKKAPGTLLAIEENKETSKEEISSAVNNP